MPTAREHYQAGELKDALATSTEEVKKHPTDQAARNFLCEMLLFAGELERADRQLDTLAHQDPTAAVAVGMVRHLIRAEEARQQFYNDGRLPEFLNQPSEVLRMHLEASILLRDNKAAEAWQLLQQAEEKRPRVSGVCDDKPFDDMRDGDDLTAPFFEVLTSTGKYYWVPMDQVELIEFRKPTRPRDLLWVRAHMIVRDGPDGEVFLPALYAGTHTQADDRVRLGRVTDWKGATGEPTRGIGQRTFLVGDVGRAILELGTITFNAPQS